jgi:hypothetical protein
MNLESASMAFPTLVRLSSDNTIASGLEEGYLYKERIENNLYVVGCAIYHPQDV